LDAPRDQKLTVGHTAVVKQVLGGTIEDVSGDKIVSFWYQSHFFFFFITLKPRDE